MAGKGQAEVKDEPFSTLLGLEGSRELIFATGEDWLGKDEIKIRCKKGHVELAEWR